MTPAKTKRRAAARRPKAPPSEDDVDAFVAGLKHPLAADIDAVRRIVLGVDPSIEEGVKWNAPSFRTTEWFATLGVRSRDTMQLVFHRGAKVKDNATGGMDVPDPDGLIRWLSNDRCLVTLGKGAEISKHRKAFEAIVRAWIRQMPPA